MAVDIILLVPFFAQISCTTYSLLLSPATAGKEREAEDLGGSGGMWAESYFLICTQLRQDQAGFKQFDY